jgi:hypothetical protein
MRKLDRETTGITLPVSSRPARISLTAVAVLFCLTACAKDTTGVSGSGIPVRDLVGTWTLTLGHSLPCADSVVERVFEVQVSGSENDVLPGGSLNFTDAWSSPSGLSGPVYGTINVKDRTLLWHLTREDSLGHGMEIRGRLAGSLALLDTRAVDPYPGYRPLVVANSCEFDVSGSRQ